LQYRIGRVLVPGALYGIPEKPLRTVSVMHFAVGRGDVYSVERCLNAELPIDLLAAGGFAALRWAVLSNKTRMADYLVGRGSPVDVRGDQGETPLMLTAL
jgi:ankyrin repeat protein